MTKDYEDPLDKINPEELKAIESKLQEQKLIDLSNKPKNISEFERKYFLAN